MINKNSKISSTTCVTCLALLISAPGQVSAATYHSLDQKSEHERASRLGEEARTSVQCHIWNGFVRPTSERPYNKSVHLHGFVDLAYEKLKQADIIFRKLEENKDDGSPIRKRRPVFEDVGYELGVYSGSEYFRALEELKMNVFNPGYALKKIKKLGCDEIAKEVETLE